MQAISTGGKLSLKSVMDLCTSVEDNQNSLNIWFDPNCVKAITIKTIC